MKPILQLALDFVDLQRALKNAKEGMAGGADWLEAGTPLIKSEGLQSIVMAEGGYMYALCFSRLTDGCPGCCFNGLAVQGNGNRLTHHRSSLILRPPGWRRGYRPQHTYRS